MQKSFITVLVIAVVGALAIYLATDHTFSAIAFLTGAIIASAVFSIQSKSTSSVKASTTPYSGPTMTLYVGNLPYRVHEGEVKALFGEYIQ